MADTSNITIRMDNKLRKQAEELFSDFGLTLSAAYIMFVKQAVREQRIPFELSSPNAKTIAAMKEAEELLAIKKARFQNADEVFNAIEKECQ